MKPSPIPLALVTPRRPGQSSSASPLSLADLEAVGRAEVRAHLAAVSAVPLRSAPIVTGVTLTRADGIRPEPIAWLWDGWLARGKVHVLAGAPGTGKTTAAGALAATLSTGGRWPDGTPAPVGDTLIWSGEDTPRDTLIPRLIAAGADLARVQFVASFTDQRGPRAFDPATDVQALADHLATLDPAPMLLIVDPVVSAVAGDSHKNAEVRRALAPLVELAQLRRVAVLGISHFSKGTQGRDPTERVTGSLAFGALARVVLATAKLPDEEGGGRILVRAKNNLGPDSGGFRFDLAPLELPGHPGIFTTAVQWGDALTGSARELLARADSHGDPEERSERREAGAWLSDLLSQGPVRVPGIMRDAKAFGFSERTLQRARKEIGAVVERAGFGGGCCWALPILATAAPYSAFLPLSGSGEYAENGANPGGPDPATAPEEAAAASRRRQRCKTVKVLKAAEVAAEVAARDAMRT